MNSFQKEISEWTCIELCNWLNTNNYRGISDLFQKYSLTGYDIFFINDKILKDELNLKSFHERHLTLKVVNNLIHEHRNNKIYIILTKYNL
jgi:hypothetical protein